MTVLSRKVVSKIIEKVEKEGREARRNNAKPSDSPYPLNSDLDAYWYRGWCAEDEMSDG